ncbi:MAG: V-type ATP synthase subunit I [Eubacterium sp.]|nr:V-type ATP synthase subunit I [Eubacterium sp.]
MAVLKMRRISITALREDRKPILEKLQALGIMEMHQLEPDGFTKIDTREDRQGFDNNVRLTEQALDVLEEYSPEKASVLSSLEGKELIDKEDYLQTENKASVLLETAEYIVGLSKKISEKRAVCQRIAAQEEQLAPWKLLGTPLTQEPQETEKTSLLLGTMPPEYDQDHIYEVIESANQPDTGDEAESEALPCCVDILEENNEARYISVICIKEDTERIETALRAAGFAKPAAASDLPPAEEIKKLREDIEKEQQDIDRASEEIAGLSEYREDLKRLGDYYRLRSEKYEVIADIPETDRTFVVSGYVDERHTDAVKKAIGDHYDCNIDIEDIPEDEDVPTVLKNNRFSSSMEGVVQSYGLPGRHEFDPTTIMSFFYVFFFGLMLSDAAYGLVMTIACAVLLWKYKRMDEGMRKQLKLFMFCGISTTFWGIMFGGYFGDVVTVVSETFFHKTVTVPALWFVPLEDPMRLLIWCLAFGIVHLFVGLAIKGYEELRDGKTLDFFCDVVLWYVFLIGLLMMLIPSEIFKSISQIDVSFPPAVNTLAKVLAAGGALGLVLMSGRDHKNPVLRLALGLYDVYGVTSWLSDVLSYSRLLALGLATGVIASVVNQMGSMAGGGIVGAVLFIIVFLIGHSMNMAINILGAYVHTNRLQFVEFFGKFYDGGGRPLEPFEQDTKYVEVKEEM